MIDIDQTLKKFKGQVETLLQQRAEIEHQLASIRQSIAGLLQFRRATLGPSPQWEAWNAQVFGNLGLTDACRNVLKAEPETAFMPAEVKRRLERSGFDFSAYKSNPLSAIHTVLKRLLENDEVEGRYYTETNEFAGYKWKNQGRTRRASPGSGIGQQ